MDAKSRILASPPKFEAIHIPDWGGDEGKYSIRVLTGRELDQLSKLLKESIKGNVELIREQMVILFLGDESGKRVFEMSDLEKVSALDGMVLERVAREGVRVNKLTDEGVQDAKKA